MAVLGGYDQNLGAEALFGEGYRPPLTVSFTSQLIKVHKEKYEITYITSDNMDRAGFSLRMCYD